MDLVYRQFTAEASAKRWVADITYVPTRTGWVCVMFILEVIKCEIVG
ncbi:hypothetical protein ACT3UQ_18820 [Glutamicibacter sp. AOP12-B1-11]